MRKISAAQRAVAAALTGMMALGSVAPAIATEIEAQDKEKVGKYVQRLYGEDRYGTMAEVVKRTEFDDPGAIVVASGTSFADALAANALAGRWGAPLVLTDGEKLSEDAADAIEDYVPIVKAAVHNGELRIYVIGGTSAISDAVVDEIASLKDVTASSIKRVDGDDRIETSLEVALRVIKGRSSNTTAIIATGQNFADALSISSYSYKAGAPIILTDANGNLTLATKQGLEGAGDFKDLQGKFGKFIIVGGESVVSEDTEDYLKDLGEVERWDGKDRYATSEEIANQLANTRYRGRKFQWSGSVLATGQNFADALAAGQYAGNNMSMVLLADDVKNPTVDTLVDMSSDAFVDNKITVAGGPNAFSDDLATSINDLIKEELDD